MSTVPSYIGATLCRFARTLEPVQTEPECVYSRPNWYIARFLFQFFFSAVYEILCIEKSLVFTVQKCLYLRMIIFAHV